MYQTVVYLTDITLNESLRMKPNKSRHGELKLKQDLEISANMSVAFMVHTRIQRHEMQTSKMSNKPKLSDPSPLQTSIVL